uniref:Uncharacterized protein n=1 Tax=Leptospira santarosai serovar Arenal str. MAVJ 401 TaxID=1049976 RepID=M6JFQ8_9LEPT|nr:hypothetical protein LEP1GSC063_0765 [Leptospira santarosai serovar Arenal str. MAVJ 401]
MWSFSFATRKVNQELILDLPMRLFKYRTFILDYYDCYFGFYRGARKL